MEDGAQTWGAEGGNREVLCILCGWEAFIESLLFIYWREVILES